MSTIDIAERFANLRVWAKDGHRAPHKPLLVLLMLARVQRGEPRLLAWRELEDDLRRLLVEFGPQRKAAHPEYPFWRLRNDAAGSLWEVPEAGRIQVSDNGDVRVAELRRRDVHGGFTVEVDAALRGDPALVNRLVADLLDAQFEPSWHTDILEAIGMPWVPDGSRRVRDQGFRREVLRIYEHACAICGYDGRLEHVGLAIDAAHVRWHAANGPDTLDNGLALCALHHRAFDKGAVSIDSDRRILVSSHVLGTSRVVDDLLRRYMGQPLREPQGSEPRVALQFAAWHRREVFREPPRTR